MKKIITIVGARPQFIKAATISRALAARQDIQEIIVHTGQHYDANMSDIFFEQMAIPKPTYHLGIGGGTHGAMTGQQLEKIEEVLLEESPHWVLVYGDTNSTLAGALAATKLHIPVAHVEAGLRSFNRKMPEEINRILTDHISTLLFAPTRTAQDNLLNESIENGRIHVVGDVMYDAALFYKRLATKPVWFDALRLAEGEFVLCTIHRAENTDDEQRLEAIFRGLADSGMPIILPLHPRTRQKIAQLGIDTAPNIHIAEPVGYLEMVWLEMRSRSIATDSGGVQKEAHFHGKPCITLRDETEWVELVAAGVNRVVGADSREISLSIRECAVLPTTNSIYGTGNSAMQIINTIAGEM